MFKGRRSWNQASCSHNQKTFEHVPAVKYASTVPLKVSIFAIMRAILNLGFAQGLNNKFRVWRFHVFNFTRWLPTISFVLFYIPSLYFTSAWVSIFTYLVLSFNRGSLLSFFYRFVFSLSSFLYCQYFYHFIQDFSTLCRILPVRFGLSEMFQFKKLAKLTNVNFILNKSDCRFNYVRLNTVLLKVENNTNSE